MSDNNPPGNSNHFDTWAKSYDRSVSGSQQFPFAGYEDVLELAVSIAGVAPGMSVLDLGTGTGNLAGRFSGAGCSVWGTDFSTEMLARAHAKYPELHLGAADLQGGLPPGFPITYDRIVSAYALHHLTLDDKCRLIRDLISGHLNPGGRLVIADIAFATVLELTATRDRVGRDWDSSEFYWAADETMAELEGTGLKMSYFRVSFCAGVFTVEPPSQPDPTPSTAPEA